MSTLAQLLGKRPASVQRVSGQTVINQPAIVFSISAVNPATTITLISGQYTDYYSTTLASELVNATTVRAIAPGNSQTVTKCSIEVIDFGPLVKSVQRGVLTSGNTATIAAVDPSKCMAIVQMGGYNLAGTGPANGLFTLNSTSLVFEVAATASLNLYWQIVEFY